MKKKTFIISFMMILPCCASAQEMLFKNPNISAEKRADDLISRLTTEEKVSLMMDGSPEISRLGIPQFQWWNEALHGIGRNGFATVFPVTIGMAASFDDRMLYNIYTAVSDEARAKNNIAKKSGVISRYQGLSYWTPNINIFRDPRWGRGQETYGEDPYLTSKMGLAVVNGLQGQTFDGKDNNKYKKLLACAKHFAVHSGPEWNRHTFNIENLPERDLWETYLPAFKSLVCDGNVAEVMCAYQRIDGDPCCANARYERQILRDEWGFKGLITSDCGAIRDFYEPNRHYVVKTAQEAAAKGILSGTDVECGSVYHNLPKAIKAGLVDEKKIDESLKRLIVARIELGDFDSDSEVSWSKIPESVIASKEHKALAYKMAQECIVLLQNKNNILPLDKNANIVVIGPNANDSIMQWGNYNGYPTETETILEGIMAKNNRVRYIPGCGLTNKNISISRLGDFTDLDGKQGLTATFWNNTDFNGTPANRVNMNNGINLSNGGNTVFAPNVNLEQFAARFEGTFSPKKDETLDMILSFDDCARLIVDGDTIYEFWRSKARVNKGTKTKEFKAGRHYKFQIDYIQKTDMAVMNFDIVKREQLDDNDFLKQVGNIDTVVFVGGISPSLEGEEMKVSDPGFKGGDRTSIELPQVQRDMISLLKKAGKHVIFINCSGSAIALTPESQNADAIIQAWYPGEAGGKAVADVLYGDVNPQGKLPITFYKNDEQLPDFLDYTMRNRTYRYLKDSPLFSFGYGLSYTTFSYDKPEYKDDKVIVKVTNTGKREGVETVEVYVKNIADSDGPLKTLKGFSKVSLKAGESKIVTIPFPRNSFEGWDTATNTMRVVPGKYQIMVGGSSNDTDLKSVVVKIK